MTDSGMQELLESVDISAYVAEQRQAGRSNLSRSFVEYWARQYWVCASMLESVRLGPELASAAVLLRDVTYPMAMQERSPIPSYYPYTCVNILDWYLGECGEDFEEMKRRSVYGIVHLLLDLGRFETYSAIGCEPFQTLKFDPQLALDRIGKLHDVYASVLRLKAILSNCRMQPPSNPSSYETVIDYAREPGRCSGLISLSCLPQTAYHDEVLFLRSIQVSEFCFYGIRVTIDQADKAIRARAYASAETFLDQAIGFADVLRQMFRVLNTMPPAHFHDFRSSAANASAVQSFNFQLLDLRLFGFSEHKVDVLSRIPHLRGLLAYRCSGFQSLRDLLSVLCSAPEASSVIEAGRRLDRSLLTWRGLHVGFARLYLSDTGAGTGGTSGAAYLKLFLKNTLFEETTDSAVDDGAGPPPAGHEHRGLSAGLHIAPPHELIQPDVVSTMSRRE